MNVYYTHDDEGEILRILGTPDTCHVIHEMDDTELASTQLNKRGVERMINALNRAYAHMT